MSFGRPGAMSDTFKVSPPQRGSFPLDHDGECKTFMLSYMRCLKSAGSDSGQCRPQARAYLECRMDNGLMTRDDFQNLGLGDVPSSDANGKLPPTAEALNQHHPSGMEKGAPPTGVSPAPPKQADRI